MDMFERWHTGKTTHETDPAVEKSGVKAASVEPTEPLAIGVPAALPSAPPRSALLEWFLHDIPFIAMLLLAMVGVVFRLPVTYWVILTPVFAVISIAEGWSHFITRNARLALIYRVALNWSALLLAIYLLYNSGVQGVMNTNAISLAMVILLALGTFVAGVQARVWQICAVGGILFVVVPSLGWLDQSPLLLAAAACLIIGLSGLAWWVTQRRGAPRSLVAPETPLI